jgi:NAD+ synthase
MKQELNDKKTIDKISKFLKQEFKERKKKAAVLGISGGIDSAFSGFLCRKAGLDLYAIIMPYKKRHLKESMMAADFLKIPKNRIFTIDIGLIVDKQIKELQKSVKMDETDKGNIMARQRMIIQYALARKFNGLVIGTENLSEYYLGYFTLHGDQACDISPINFLFKTEIYKLASNMNFPQWILKRPPTAGLWQGQTDEDELGFTYKEADQIIYYLIIKKLSKEQIIKKGFNLSLINKVLERIKNTEYKREDPPKMYL